MAKSTQCVTDAAALRDGTFSAASTAKAIAATGPIQDLNGMGSLVALHFQEALNMLTQMKNGTDSGDTLRTQIQALIDVLV